MKTGKGTLTGQELEIMKVIWRLGPVTVRQVYEAMREQRQVAYTTVMTMMKILEQKGHLKKSVAEKAHIYEPTRAKHLVIGSMVREYNDLVFNGSAEPLLMHLVEDRQLSEKEIREIERILRERKKHVASGD